MGEDRVMSWDYGMDHDKNRWESVSKNLKKQGYTILGDDGEYLYWAKWTSRNLLKKKESRKSMKEIKKMLVDDYNEFHL
jgi:hypothetical protein